MKKRKLILGMVVALTGVMAMSSCDVTYLDGVIFTYTDAQGNRVEYTAEELFRNYQTSVSVAKDDFELIKEVLIRKYYELDANASIKAELEKLARNDVDGAKADAISNATSNGTTYEEELEKILESADVDNIDEYYQKCLYDEEESRFETDYYTQENIDAMRDGYYTVDGQQVEMFPASEEYGIGNEGYLLEKMPYHVSHILLKFASASDGDHTSATISESEAKKVAQVVEELAGANTSNPSQSATSRMNFGNIALESSEDNEGDSSSAANYGDLGIMDLDTSYIQEFKLGLYAYEALYNQENQEGGSNSYGLENKDRLLPTEDTEYQDGTKELNVIESFEERGIGVIPYGVFAALGNDSIAKDPDLGYEVNDNDSYFYARNVLFNKYLNNHQIAVIVPNRIATNDLLDGVHSADEYEESKDLCGLLSSANDFTSEDFVGTIDEEYAALPGFSVDTTSILGIDQLGQSSNVLTDQDGKIILVARGGGSSYQGIHFITVTRSALSEYGTTFDGTTVSQNTTSSTTSDVSSLSEYYTMSVPSESSYPKYTNTSGVETAKTTYVNQFRSQQNTYQSRADSIKTDVMTYNDSLDTYIFQELIEGGASGGKGYIEFADEQIGNLVKKYIRTSRQADAEDVQKDFDDDWQEYAEYLVAADEDRVLNEDGSQWLLSEAVVLTYESKDAQEGIGRWGIGGACYDGK